MLKTAAFVTAAGLRQALSSAEPSALPSLLRAGAFASKSFSVSRAAPALDRVTRLASAADVA